MKQKWIDLTGQKFGRWTALERVIKPDNKNTYWLCQCECGTIKEVMGKNLHNGRSSSCGCYKKEVDGERMTQLNKARALDLRGEKYGFLTPIRPTEQRLSSSIVWECLCDCGNTTYVSVDNLRGQHPVCSCGCAKRSFGEQNIVKILQANHIAYIEEYALPNKMSRFDFAILDTNKNIIRFIEFDGEQHYKDVANWDSVKVQKERDARKNQYVLSHNIPLVRIPYWERDNINLEMIMDEKYLIH